MDRATIAKLLQALETSTILAMSGKMQRETKTNEKNKFHLRLSAAFLLIFTRTLSVGHVKHSAPVFLECLRISRNRRRGLVSCSHDKLVA